MSRLSFRKIAAFAPAWLLLLVVFFNVDAARAAPSDLDAELRRTDAAISDAVRAAGPQPPESVTSLLAGARDRQAEARLQRRQGRTGRALLATRVARRLAERALAALTPAPDRADQLERQLQRGDRRLAAARAWLSARAARPRLLRQLGRAEGEMAKAWRAYRQGRVDDALLSFATVRQFIRDLESHGFATDTNPTDARSIGGFDARGGAGEESPAAAHLAATERLLDACAAATLGHFPHALQTARESHAAALRLAGAGRARDAGLATLVLRADLVTAWSPELPRTEAMSATLLLANDLVIERVAATALGFDGPRLGRLREAQEDGRRALAAHHPLEAWNAAAGVTRQLADGVVRAR